jgi:hypothetical protein
MEQQSHMLVAVQDIQGSLPLMQVVVLVVEEILFVVAMEMLEQQDLAAVAVQETLAMVDQV